MKVDKNDDRSLAWSSRASTSSPASWSYLQEEEAKILFFECCFPMFVPSLSWLNTHFEYKNFIISRISVMYGTFRHEWLRRFHVLLLLLAPSQL
jgi:hypothetical protein